MTKKQFKRWMITSLLVLIFLILLGLVIIPAKVTSVIYERQEEVYAKEAEELKKNNAFEAWLDELADLECPNCGVDFRRMDSNGRYSHACLQFQRRTFDYMAERYKVRIELPPGDRANEPIYSCELQRRIATAMFRDDAQAASRHWYTSIYKKGLGLPPEI